MLLVLWTIGLKTVVFKLTITVEINGSNIAMVGDQFDINLNNSSISSTIVGQVADLVVVAKQSTQVG
jgi:hypothetical protein